MAGSCRFRHFYLKTAQKIKLIILRFAKQLYICKYEKVSGLVFKRSHVRFLYYSAVTSVQVYKGDGQYAPSTV